MGSIQIDVKTAIKKAFSYAKDFYGSEELKNLALEEVQFEESNNVWEITLGFDGNRKVEEFLPPKSNLSFLLQGRDRKVIQERKYKTFRVAAEDGSFRGMEIRQIE